MRITIEGHHVSDEVWQRLLGVLDKIRHEPEQTDYDNSTELRHPFPLLRRKTGLVGAEIGVGQGVNAFNMLTQLNVKKLYLIDPYTPHKTSSGKGIVSATLLNEWKDIAINRLSSFDNAQWIFLPSASAISHIQNESLDFVYVDGDHSHAAVEQDLELYYPKVKWGGLIAGDDYRRRERGLRKAVNEFIILHYANLYTQDIQWWFWKTLTD